MTSIDDLLAVLNTRIPGDRISRISLTRRELSLQRACTKADLHFIASFDCGEGSDGTIESDWCLFMEKRLLPITIVEKQEEIYRLWDGEGGEIVH